MTWSDDQRGEAQWWGDCANTYNEETKQLLYADRMGLVDVPTDGQGIAYDIGGRSVVDLGGGPVSLLLKCVNRGRCAVVDPGQYPDWIDARYEHCGIEWVKSAAEGYDKGTFDEAWIYNCLQHTIDPARIVANARKLAPVVRIFEWVDIPAHAGHPHELTARDLDRWLDGKGATEWFTGYRECYGTAYHGVFG